MKLTITINCDNAAFCPDHLNVDELSGSEPARILRKLADDYLDGTIFKAGWSRPLLDANGNKVGHVEVEG